MNTSTISRSLLCLSGCFLLLSAAFARFDVWQPENGVAVRQGDHIGWVDHSTAMDGDGHFLTVWSESGTGSSNVHAQLFTMDGTPVWDEDLVIADTPYPEQEARVIRTTDGAWIIVWLNYEEDTQKQGTGRAFAHKVNDDGTFAWANAYGPLGSVTCGLGDFPAARYGLFPTTDGGALFYGDLYYEPYVQRIQSDASPPWETTRSFIGDDSGLPKVIPDGSGGIILMNRSFVDVPSVLRGQRIDQDGNYLWEGDQQGIVFETVPTQNDWDISELEDGSWLLAQAGEGVIFLQLYDLNGTAQWEAPGLSVPYTSSFIFNTTVRRLSATDFLLSWRVSNGSFHFHRISLAGDEPQLLFGETDFILPASEWEQDATLGSHNEVLLLSGRRIDGYYSGQYLHSILADGTESWSSEVFAFDPNEYINWDRVGPATLLVHDGNATITGFGRSGMAVGMISRQLDLETGDLIGCEALPLAAGVFHETYNTRLQLSEDKLLVSWMDLRYGASIYFQFLDRETGAAQFEAGGVDAFPGLEGSIAPYSSNHEPHTASPDGMGGLVILTPEYDQASYTSHIRAQRIDASGNLLWGEMGYVVHSETQQSEWYKRLHSMSLDDGKTLFVYSQYSAEFGRTLKMNILLADGTLLHDSPTVFYEESAYSELYPRSLYTLEDGDILIVCQGDQYPEWESEILITRINRQGEIVWNFIPDGCEAHYTSWALLGNDNLALVHSDYQAETYRLHIVNPDGELMSGPEGILIPLAEDCRIRGSLVPFEDSFGFIYSSDSETYYQRVSEDGSLLFEEPMWLHLADSHNIVKTLPDPDGGVWLIIKENWFFDFDFSYLHINAQGQLTKPEYEEGPVPLCDAWFRQDEVEVISDGEGGFFAGWTDYRGSAVELHYDDVYAMRVNDFTTGLGERTSVEAPGTFALLPAYPNPFNPSTTLTYTVPEAGQVRLAVYDVLGREVVRLVDGVQPIGTHRVLWQSQSSSGRGVASGTYFIRYDTPKGMTAQRVLLLK